MKSNTKKLTVKDIMSIVILAVLGIAIQFIVSAVGMTFLNFFFIGASGIIQFLSAPLYLLAANRVAKRGTAFLFIFLSGLVYGLMGYWFLIPYFAICGLLCELILAGTGAYQSFSRNTAAWCVYSLFYQIGNAIPIWFIWESYKKQMLCDGATQDFLKLQLSYNTTATWIIGVSALTVILAALGMLFGQMLLKKHFQRAGLTGKQV